MTGEEDKARKITRAHEAGNIREETDARTKDPAIHVIVMLSYESTCSIILDRQPNLTNADIRCSHIVIRPNLQLFPATTHMKGATLGKEPQC